MKARLALILLCGALLAPLQAFAAPGYSTAAVNMRAGPGTGYPAFVVIPRHASVTIVSCLDGYSWCDVSWGNYRGWVAGDYLRAGPRGHITPLYRTPPPIAAFNFNTYWDSHYRSRPFYRDRDHWRSRYYDNSPGHRNSGNNPAWTAPNSNHPSNRQGHGSTTTNQPWAQTNPNRQPNPQGHGSATNTQPWNQPGNNHRSNTWGHDSSGNRCRIGAPGCR